ncbi:MAG: hypothetical protein C0506_02550 [Anaerolinea sp.]|nr:hypothetical protein [Anaerolinea sp.]
MREAEVDPELCDGCQDCIEECVYDAVALIRVAGTKRLKARVDPDRCCGCNACAPACPVHGIVMNWLGRPPREEMHAVCGSRAGY